MNIEQEIKELRERLDELEKQVKQKKITGRYIPEHLQNYFYVNSVAEIIKEVNNQVNMDMYRISIGNCFETEEEAEKHKRILINTQKLKDLAERLNGDEEIDWDTGYRKYFLYVSKGNLRQDWNTFDQTHGAIYCLNRYFLTKAVGEIGEEALIELITG